MRIQIQSDKQHHITQDNGNTIETATAVTTAVTTVTATAAEERQKHEEKKEQERSNTEQWSNEIAERRRGRGRKKEVR